jgi:hypothetical protein
VLQFVLESANEKAAEAQGLAAFEDRNNDQADSP